MYIIYASDCYGTIEEANKAFEKRGDQLNRKKRPKFTFLQVKIQTEIYSDILKEVVEWNPSNEGLEQVKKFARLQLEKKLSRLKTNLEEINNYSNSELYYSYSEKLSIIEKKIDDLIAEWDSKLKEAEANERILQIFNESFEEEG